MAFDKDHIPPADWVQRLARYQVANADPVLALARYATQDPVELRTLDDNGDFHFPAPAAWRESHQFSVPKGFRHSGGDRDRLFSPELGGGRGLAMWLGTNALGSTIPYDAAVERLQKRADALCNALKNKLNIEPLEARIYIPKASVREATRDRGSEVSACLILATDHAHRDMLTQQVYPQLRNAMIDGWRLNQQEATPKESKPSSRAVEKMLAEHRDPVSQEAHLSKPLFPLQEMADGLDKKPYRLDLKADGYFHFVIPTSDGVKHTYCISPEHLSHPNSKHVLVLPMRSDFSAMPMINPDYPIRDPEHNPGGVEASDYDRYCIRPATEIITAALGSDWNVSTHYQTPMGNMVVISVEAPNAPELLDQAKAMINEARQYRFNKHADWRDMLEVRGIDPTPPSR